MMKSVNEHLLIAWALYGITTSKSNRPFEGFSKFAEPESLSHTVYLVSFSIYVIYSRDSSFVH